MQVCDLGALHQEREVLLQMSCDSFNNEDNVVAQFAVGELLTSADTNQNAD